MENVKEINVLWMGGWDSTFRVLSLSRLPIKLKTHYVVYPNRRSREYELKAMREIFELIKADERTKCRLEPINIVKYEDIPADDEVTRSFEKIKEQVLIGNQYEYLARFAKTLGSLEIGIEQGGLAEEMMNRLGRIVNIPADIPELEYCELDKDESSQELLNVFGYFKYPIFRMTKLQMKERAIRDGYIDIMYKTWFCHFPRHGKPCGTCFPCHFTIEDGLEERFDKAAIKRHAFDQKHKDDNWYKKYKRLRRKYLNY